MDIFNSQWLIHMLAKSGKTPQERILSLFDILQDWINAPNIQIELEEKANSQALIAFCIEQATACGAANPEILAEHIVLIARNAATQEINQPNSGSFIHARKAAQALILAQTQQHSTNKKAVYGIAASLVLVLAAGAIWLPLRHQMNPAGLANLAGYQTQHHKQQIVAAAYPERPTSDTGITADEAAKMYAKYEQMRNGTCQFPEALQIPDKDKSVYIENVVGGNLPTNLNDLATANYYLEKIRCNFTPMLMANSK